jgi:hypothetical protein
MVGKLTGLPEINTIDLKQKNAKQYKVEFGGMGEMAHDITNASSYVNTASHRMNSI